MSLTIKNLGEGQLPDAKGTLYTVPAATQAIVREILCTNETAGDLTMNLYANFSGTSRRLTPVSVPIPASGQYKWRGVLTLETGDLVEGDASVATDVDYIISGAENA